MVLKQVSSLAIGVVLSLALAGCTLDGVIADITGATTDITTVAAAIDAGINTVAAADLPVVCSVLTTFTSYAQSAVTAGLVKPGSRFAIDIKTLQDLGNAPGCAAGTTPTNAGLLIADIVADIALVKMDLNGQVTAVASVNPSSPAAVALRNKAVKMHRRF